MMETFIGVKCVKAEWHCNDKGEPGYKVVYPDGYESWCPGEAFEKYYFPVTRSDKLTPEDIRNWMDMSISTSVDGDAKTTLTRVEMPSGFIDWEASSCVSPENYNQEIGRKICLEHIETRVWKLLGFVLQWGVHGLSR